MHIPQRYRPPRWYNVVAALLATSFVLSGCAGALTDGPELATAEVPRVDTSSMTPDPFEFPALDDVPQESLSLAVVVDPAVEQLEQLSLEQKIASLFLVHLPGQDSDVHADFVSELPVAGFLLLSNNLAGDAEQTREFISTVRKAGPTNLLMAIDQEGGDVVRLSGDTFASAPELGQQDPEATREATRARNQLVFDAGANLNLGVIADVSPGPDAYIHNRAFGTDASLVSDRVVAALEGSVGGVAVAVKHFPGHGLTREDTHETLGVSSIDFDQWREEHGVVFQTAVDDGVAMMMLGHLVLSNVDSLPASVSPAWIELLRNQWGYQGIIVSDDLAMLQDSGDERFQDFDANVVAALTAGVDLIIDSGGDSPEQTSQRLTSSIDAVVDAVERNEITEESIDESALRVLRLRQSLGGVVRPLEDAQAGQLSG